MTEDELQLLRGHFSAKTGGRPPRCTVCDATDWEVAGITDLPLNPRRLLRKATDAKALPVVVLVCTNCFHVIQFAWVPLKAAGDERDRERRGTIQALHKMARGG